MSDIEKVKKLREATGAGSKDWICRLIADWLRFKLIVALVKLPASATAWNIFNLSQSIICSNL